jgi:hypothetical protein
VSRKSMATSLRFTLLRLGLPALALLVIVSPGFAATPQPQVARPEAKAEAPDATCPAGGQCFADVLPGTTFYDFVNRIYQQDLVTGYLCGGEGEPCDAENRPYYRPGANVTRQQMAKFIDNARRLPEIHIAVTGGAAPVYASNATGGAIGAYSVSGQALTAQSVSQSAIYAQSGNAVVISAFSTGGTDGVGVYGTAATGLKGSGTNAGVSGLSSSGIGVSGMSTSSYGVAGSSESSDGVWGYSIGHIGVYGRGAVAGVQGDSDTGPGVQGFSDVDAIYGSTNTGNAIHGFSANGNWAGYFEGNVNVTGTCCGMGEAYTRIDYPLDPAHKYLNQSLVASPDMLEIYRGHVTLDANGVGMVQLPPYFEALNRDFDYQLTPVGAAMPDLHVAQEVQGNSFRIGGGKPGLKVSWQVTATRSDPYALAHPIQTVQDKIDNEQGKYLHPTEWGQPKSLGIGYEEHQEMINSAKR